MKPINGPDLVDTVARPHPGRLLYDAYPVRGSAPARYADMDYNGHLNNLALEAIHEDTRARFNALVFPGLYDSGQRSMRLLTAQNVVHFLAEARWPAVLDTAAGAVRIGEKSFVAATALFQDGHCVSVCNTVLVSVGDDGPAAIPEPARAALRKYLIELH